MSAVSALCNFRLTSMCSYDRDTLLRIRDSMNTQWAHTAAIYTVKCIYFSYFHCKKKNYVCIIILLWAYLLWIYYGWGAEENKHLTFSECMYISKTDNKRIWIWIWITTTAANHRAPADDTKEDLVWHTPSDLVFKLRMQHECVTNGKWAGFGLASFHQQPVSSGGRIIAWYTTGGMLWQMSNVILWWTHWEAENGLISLDFYAGG